MLKIVKGFHFGFTFMLASMTLIMAVVLLLYYSAMDVGGVASQQEFDTTALVSAFFALVTLVAGIASFFWLKRSHLLAIGITLLSYTVFSAGVWAWANYDAPTLETAGCKLISSGPCPRPD